MSEEEVKSFLEYIEKFAVDVNAHHDQKGCVVRALFQGYNRKMEKKLKQIGPYKHISVYWKSEVFRDHNRLCALILYYIQFQ